MKSLSLRKGDREIYVKFLKEKYEKKFQQEMESFDRSAGNLVKIGKDEAIALFNKDQVNLLKSDISFLDNDAIYSMYRVNIARKGST